MHALQHRVEDLENQQKVVHIGRDWRAIAYLTPGSDGYSMIGTDVGDLPVQLQGVAAYANGSLVIIRIGNVTGATITDAKASVEWGSVDEGGFPLNDSARVREVAFRSLRSGAWTTVRVVLEAVAPAELGFVRVRDLSQSGFSLLR